MHVELDEAVISCDMIPVGMCVQEHERKVGVLSHFRGDIYSRHACINDKRPFLPRKKKDTHSHVLNCPCILK